MWRDHKQTIPQIHPRHEMSIHLVFIWKNAVSVKPWKERGNTQWTHFQNFFFSSWILCIYELSLSCTTYVFTNQLWFFKPLGTELMSPQNKIYWTQIMLPCKNDGISYFKVIETSVSQETGYHSTKSESPCPIKKKTSAWYLIMQMIYEKFGLNSIQKRPTLRFMSRQKVKH